MLLLTNKALTFDLDSFLSTSLKKEGRKLYAHFANMSNRQHVYDLLSVFKFGAIQVKDLLSGGVLLQMLNEKCHLLIKFVTYIHYG